MIARVWHGIVSKEKAVSYGQYLANFGVLDYRSIPGNRAVHVLQRVENDGVHFILISLWDSREAIEAYAGPDIERAHYYSYDLECLVDPEQTVLHYEVLATTEGDNA